MFTGILRLDMIVPGSKSLKYKRRILKSLTEKLRNKFNISVAEVGDSEKWQTASLGISTVSNSGYRIDNVLDNVMRFIETDGRVEIIRHYKETI